MTLRMELWVEGPTDARTHRTSNVWARPHDDEEAPTAMGGALVPLLRNALLADGVTPETLADELPDERMKARRLSSRLQGIVRFENRQRHSNLSNKGAKVLAAMDRARTRHPDLLVLAVWDRDGQDEPLRDRNGIHEVLRRRGETGSAVAICVEEIEAWLLADATAFRHCFKRGPKGGLPGDPEAEADPKEKLMAVLSEMATHEDDRATLYRTIAEKVDIDVLARRCPRGFGELRNTLREFIEPCLRGTRGAAEK